MILMDIAYSKMEWWITVYAAIFSQSISFKPTVKAVFHGTTNSQSFKVSQEKKIQAHEFFLALY